MFQFELKKAEPSQETLFDDILTVLGTIGMFILIGWLAWDSWRAKHPKASDKDIMDQFIKNIKRDQVAKMFDNIAKMDDESFDRLLTIKSDVSPDLIKMDIDFNKKIRTVEYPAVCAIRNKLLTFNPKDIAENKGPGFKLLCDLEKQDTVGTIEDDSTFYDAPKKYASVAETLLKSKTEPSKTLKELGWTKSNIHLLRDHIFYFMYDSGSFISKYEADNKKFYDETTKFLTRMFPYVDWFHEEDPKDPEDIKEELFHIEQDEGCVSYAFGQDAAWRLTEPYLDFIIDGANLMGPMETLHAICKMFKEFAK